MALSVCLRIAWWVYLSLSVLPGYYWTINSTVALCGSAKYYCPGTFLDNHRCVLYVEELQLLHETLAAVLMVCAGCCCAAAGQICCDPRVLLCTGVDRTRQTVLPVTV